MKPVQVLLHDPHPVSRNGIRKMINMQPGLSVVAESGTFEHLLTQAENRKADLLIMEIENTGNVEVGLEHLAIFHASHPGIPILVLTLHDEQLYARSAMRMGASGFVMKSESQSRIAQAVNMILAGRFFLSQAVIHRLLAGQVGAGICFFSGFEGDVSKLSPREIVVFRFMGLGKSTREIAATMNVNIRTVYAHTSNIRKKMKLERSRDLASLAESWLNQLP
jgi:DNA-binding NarL/FixJ family response regulator